MSTGAAAAGAAARRAERRLVEHLRAAGALSPSSASPIPEQRWMGNKALRRLVTAGAIREAKPGYYLDEANYSAYRARRNRNTIVIMAVLAVAAGLVIWWASAGSRP
jgi:hypothetical protein